MRTRFLPLVAALCVAVVSGGCKKDEPASTFGSGGSGTLTLTASDPSVIANGTNQVTISVTNTTGSSATLTTDRGTFVSSGTSTVTVAGASGTAALRTCNETTAGCAGVAHVNGLAGSTSDSVTVTFVRLAVACSADCSVDSVNCAGLACVSGTGAGTCSSTTVSSCTVTGGGGGGGGGTTASKVVTVTPARTRMPPDGASKTDVVVKVEADGAVVSGAAVTIAVSAGGGTLSSGTGTTDANGLVTVQLTAPAAAAVATITATATAAPAATGTATVTFPRLGTIEFTDKPVEHLVQGVKGSGWNELGFLQVRVLDDTGAVYPDGLPVRFQHQQLGGSTLTSALNDASCTALAGCVFTSQTTTSGAGDPDSAGLATAWIHSGTQAGTLRIAASATIAGVTRSVELPTVAVVGAKASGANFSIVCGPRNVPALAETDCSVSLVDAPFTCVALLKDRYNNLLGRSTQVIFASEAAGVGQVAVTPAYDPGADPAGQSELGSALEIFNTLGAGLPFDVEPQPGEPSTTHNLDLCGTRVHNPRDGVVTVIAMADGEEAFFDVNGNGVYDGGEPYVDGGEPFVDLNDDGVWNDGVAGGPPVPTREWYLDVNGNDQYDGPNGQWDANSKLWTQTPVVYTGEAATVPGPTPARFLGARWSSTGVQACTETPADPGFAVTHKVTGPPEIPASSEDHWVYASDLNLNMLHTGAGYAVTVAAGTIKAQYWGLSKYSDELGFFYRYWPCDSTGANCASQCRVTANLPCLMTPSIFAFSCGPRAAVTITGGDKAESAAVEWSIDTPYSVYGSDKVALEREWLTGVVTTPP